MFSRKHGVVLAKPKKLHSLEYLKYLYTVLQKNPIVTEHNSEAIVEAVRLLAEILIWGDQNDSAIMDFFLEKNLLEFFIKYVKQNPSRTVCVQLLQTLNILFENITNQTAIYYLLSNNHTNEIIAHRFDFADEEIVAYYISFLKTLSLRLNPGTINFFYIEQRQEFDLYVEAIKLFCHPESMVRIAVRTITLNVHRVKDQGALEFIHHQTSLPYFSYLVWSLGNTILDIDALLRSDMSPQCQTRLDDLVAEHVDLLHYINDLLSLNIDGVNDVLCDQLLHRLFIPLHVYSLTQRHRASEAESKFARRPHVAHPVSSLMLSHVFIILNHPDVVRILAEAIFFGDPSLTDLLPVSSSTTVTSPTAETPSRGSLGSIECGDSEDIWEEDTTHSNPAVVIATSLVAATKAIRAARNSPAGGRLSAYLASTNVPHRQLSFTQPRESLETGLKNARGVTPNLLRIIWPSDLAPLRLMEPDACDTPTAGSHEIKSTQDRTNRPRKATSLLTSSSPDSISELPFKDLHLSPLESSQCLSVSQPDLSVSSTPAFHLGPEVQSTPKQLETSQSKSDTSFTLNGRPFLRSLFRALEVGPGTDYETLFALLLFLAIRANPGIDIPTLQLASLADPDLKDSDHYDNLLVEKLLRLINDACKATSRVRLITLYVAILLLTELTCSEEHGCLLSDEHFAQVLAVREEATMVLRSYFRNDAIFLDLFEYELRQLQKSPLDFSKIAMDFHLLIPPLAASVLNENAVPTLNIRLAHWRHLPHVELEHTQRAIGAFLLVYIWVESLLRARPSDRSDMSNPLETYKPTKTDCMLSSKKLPVDLYSMPGFSGLANIPDPKITASVHKAGDKLDLSSQALVGCTVETGGSHEKRFLLNYNQQLVLVEPDCRQMGWGVITFIGPLQDLEATCDPADSRCLHVTIHSPGHLTLSPARSSSKQTNTTSLSSTPRRSPNKALLIARFLFEDHIRCMTARHMLIHGCELARHTRLRKVATLLDFSPQYLRDNFVFGGPNGGFSLSSSNTPHLGHSSSATASLAADFHKTSQPSNSSSSEKSSSRDPGTFLLERQSRRLRSSNRVFVTEDQPPAPRVSLVSLAAMTKPTVPPAIPAHRQSVPVVPPRTRIVDSISRTPVALVHQQLPTHHKAPIFSVAPYMENTLKDSSQHSTESSSHSTIS